MWARSGRWVDVQGRAQTRCAEEGREQACRRARDGRVLRQRKGRKGHRRVGTGIEERVHGRGRAALQTAGGCAGQRGEGAA